MKQSRAYEIRELHYSVSLDKVKKTPKATAMLCEKYLILDTDSVSSFDSFLRKTETNQKQQK